MINIIFRKIKTTLGCVWRGLIGIKDNFFDAPCILKNITSHSLGETILGESIKYYSFGNGKEKVLYFGGIHGNETGTIKLMKRWVNYLHQNTETYNNKQLFVIPCLNLDGYNKARKNPDYFHGGTIGKTNANDVDLNRNFPTSNWSKNTVLFVAGKYRDISGGNFPASESEIKLLIDFIQKNDIQTVYVYHNCWGTIMSTFCESSDKKAQSYAEKSGYNIFTKSDWNALKDEQKTGHGTAWGIEQDIDYIEVELRTRWGSEWNKNKRALINSTTL